MIPGRGALRPNLPLFCSLQSHRYRNDSRSIDFVIPRYVPVSTFLDKTHQDPQNFYLCDYCRNRWAESLDAFPITLVIFSTVMHAAWNLLVRSSGGTRDCLWRMQLSIVVIGAVPACISLVTYPSLTITAVFCLIGSGVCCGLYYLGLAKGYETGDFTTVYPAARALPVLLIGIGDILRGHPPDIMGWVGMLFVATGCFFVPLNSLSGFQFRHYLKPVSLWIIITAFGTVGYSLFDKIGTEAIPRGPREAAVYCYLFQLMAFVSSYLLRIFVSKPIDRASKTGWFIPAIAGVLCFLAYWLVLWAFQMVAQASYVVAFRQFSIVIGMIAAFFILNESGKIIRFAGAISITVGLLLLKFFGA
jgi:drug/metabolite transporter (DMT)-like permease